MQATERKLEGIEEELAKDDDEEKQHRVDELNQRIHHSLKALKAHSDSYEKMLAATMNTSGARFRVESASIEESTCR